MSEIRTFERIVQISDANFCPKSEQKHSDFRRFSVRTKIGTEPNLSVRNPNAFGFQHSTVPSFGNTHFYRSIPPS